MESFVGVAPSTTQAPSARNVASRTISAIEVREWFGASKSHPNDEWCDKLAASFTRMLWSGEKSPAEAPWLPRIVEPEIDRAWDPKAAIDAATALHACLPSMLLHWEGLQWAAETRGGHDAIAD
jgi:hypothetical protein